MTRQVLAIIGKDLLLERRSKANLNALIFLGGLILVIISFALGPSPTRLHSAAGGILWVAFSFASVLAFARAYQSEADNRCFEGLLLAGATPKAIYIGKLAATIIVLLTVEVVVTVSMGLLYGIQIWPSLPGLAMVSFFGTVGIASVGVLYGRLTMSLRGREIMLPLLVLPVVIPVILAAVKSSSLVLTGSTSGLGTWIELLLVFDVVFLTAGILTFDMLCEE